MVCGACIVKACCKGCVVWFWTEDALGNNGSPSPSVSFWVNCTIFLSSITVIILLSGAVCRGGEAAGIVVFTAFGTFKVWGVEAGVLSALGRGIVGADCSTCPVQRRNWAVRPTGDDTTGMLVGADIAVSAVGVIF